MNKLMMILIAAIVVTGWGAETNVCTEASIRAYVEKTAGIQLGDNGAPPPVMASFNFPKIGIVIGYREPDAPTESRTAYLTYDGERFAGLLLMLPPADFAAPTEEKSGRFVSVVAKELNLTVDALRKNPKIGSFTITALTKEVAGQPILVGFAIR